LRLTKKLTLAASAAILTAALAVSGCARKDPKEVVIEAFEGVYSEDQISPSEEVFGAKAINETMLNEGGEGGLTLKLESCTDAQINMFAGSGVRIEGKTDRANQKSYSELTAIYNGMDLATMQMYLGDESILVKIPELSGRVLALDISDGLMDRVTESPLIGPALAQSGIDMDEFSAYMDEVLEEVSQEGGSQVFDFTALWNRYKEGSQAQANFKAALTVEKLDTKQTYTVDGKEEKCTAYQVHISKDSMIEFLETSSDFFLQDEALREEYLKQLETTVRLSKMMGSYGAGASIPSAAEMLSSSYEDMEKAVDEAIVYLDKALDDVDMTVYVTKKGHLAAIEGSTTVSAETGVVKNIGVAFSAKLQGGTYRTQNSSAEIVLTNNDTSTEIGTFSLETNGTFDKEVWSSGFSAKVKSVAANETYEINYAGTYNRTDGDFEIEADLSGAGQTLAALDIAGVVDQLEKGKSYSITMDKMDISLMSGFYGAKLSGDLYYQPLSDTITAPEGTQFDVLAATENDWFSLIMEVYGGVSKLAQQLGIDL